jgi:hypothetical protein
MTKYRTADLKVRSGIDIVLVKEGLTVLALSRDVPHTAE